MGQDTSQQVDNESNANDANVKLGTNDNTGKTPLGQPKSIIGAQQEHNGNAVKLPENQGLKRIIEAWPDLPEAMKKGILAMIEAANAPERNENGY